jgi:hypothetical protein
MRPVKTAREWGKGKIKENGGGGEFNYDWYIVRTFVNATMYLQYDTTIIIIIIAKTCLMGQRFFHRLVCIWGVKVSADIKAS